jgi:branched-chain amino acid transport system permease protein
MTLLLQTLLNGLALGSVYALISLGFTLVHKASGAMNFAHGSLLLLGGYLIAVLHGSLGFPLAVAVGATVTATAAVLESAVLRRVRATGAAVPTILTIGVDILLFTLLSRQIGTQVLTLGDPWGARIFVVGGATIPQTTVASLAVAAGLVGGFFALFRWSYWGLAMRANSSDREAAALMGIRGNRVRAGAWALAGAMAAVAAVFLVAFPSPGLDQSTGQVAMAAFPAAVLGGLDSVEGALVGSVVIGVAESATAGYEQQLSVLGSGFSTVVPYAVLVLVLIARPQGLFAAKESTRA